MGLKVFRGEIVKNQHFKSKCPSSCSLVQRVQGDDSIQPAHRGSARRYHHHVVSYRYDDWHSSKYYAWVARYQHHRPASPCGLQPSTRFSDNSHHPHDSHTNLQDPGGTDTSANHSTESSGTAYTATPGAYTTAATSTSTTTTRPKRYTTGTKR